MKKALYPMLTVAVTLAATAPAAASTLAVLNNFETQVISWAGVLSTIAFFGAGFMLLFAHDHMTQMMGTLARWGVVAGALGLGATFLTNLGVNSTGALLR